MGNLFDGIQGTAFDIVTNTMGYDATWTPLAGGPQQTARVLLNKPTESRHWETEEYNPIHYKMEYKEGDFSALKAAADAKPNMETVNVNGIDYLVRAIVSKFDGKNFIATLEPKT